MSSENDRGPSALALLVPFATAFAALLLGAGMGGVVGWVAHGPTVVEVPRDPSPEELAKACAPEVAAKSAEVEEARGRVDTLTRTVAEREAQVQQLEAEMTSRAERGRAFAAELSTAKAELESLRTQLETALTEQRRLQGELTLTVARLEQTEDALDEQVIATEMAEADALVAKWGQFIQSAQLEICEKGSRKKLGSCRETIEVKVGAVGVHTAFDHCVRSEQSTPNVRELGKDEALPAFARWIDQDDRIVQGWFIQLCDPTLPEATDLEDNLPR